MSNYKHSVKGVGAGCPDNTEWFLVTNGDNEYATTLFSHLEQSRDADIVAFDFYSRYQRTTGERGTASPRLLSCWPTLLR